VTSDIGAMLPLRWQAWQRSWRMGATSRVNVTPPVCADAVAAANRAAAASDAVAPGASRLVFSFASEFLLLDRHLHVAVRPAALESVREHGGRAARIIP